MFTTGAVFLPFFSLLTFMIAVPTGVKMFNWVFTLFRGQLTFSTPLIFALGFLTMFLIGGINGAFSASVPVDFALHDTYWVVAHLHYVLFGGSVFGVFAGRLLLVPEDDRPDARRGTGQAPVRAHVHRLQPDVLPDAHARDPGDAAADRRLRRGRRLERLEPRGDDRRLHDRRLVPARSSGTSSSRSAAAAVAGDDPWEANTLEWATSSPPPPYNFDHLPEIRSERPLFDARHGRAGH